jgi:bifunctional aspartokinase / homoserine dehydrogenase 1
MNKPIVAKFGGSNMKTSRDIRLIVDAVKRYEKPLVVVVSALYGLTDRLCRVVHSVKDDDSLIGQLHAFLMETKREIVCQFEEDPARREQVMRKLAVRIEELERYLKGIHFLGQVPDFAEDLVLSYGERLSSSLLESVLEAEGLDCEEVLPEDMGLFTDGEFGNASIDFARSREQVRQRLSGGRVYVVPGFYGISPGGKVTLLGRGGSDYSAAAIARCLDARSLDVWKDVDGFMTADPRTVPEAMPVRRLSYREAAELSYFGAKILHPRTVEPLADAGIPIRVLGIAADRPDSAPATVINGSSVISPGVVKSVAATDRIGVLRLDGPGIGSKPGILAQASSALENKGINIKSVFTALTAITMLLDDADLEPAAAAIAGLGLTAVGTVTSDSDTALVAAVGEGIRDQHGILSRITGVLAEQKVNIKIIASGPSDVAAYIIVSRGDRQKAVSAIHREFFSGPGSGRPG